MYYNQERTSVINALKLNDRKFQKRKIRISVCGKRTKNSNSEKKNEETNKKAKFEGERSTAGALRRLQSKQKINPHNKNKISKSNEKVKKQKKNLSKQIRDTKKAKVSKK